MTSTDYRLARSHLKAVVAIWLTNGQKPVDGANSPRDFVDNDWLGAANVTEELIESGHLANASGDLAMQGDFCDLNVWPTAKGLFEALS